MSATLTASQDVIPVLDLGAWRSRTPGAAARLAAELRHASEHVGFYFITNHGIPQAQIDAVFAQAARFHALPLEQKLALKINRHQIGYLPIGGVIYKTSQVNRNTKHDLNEALFIRRDRTPDDPDVIRRRAVARPQPVARRPAGFPRDRARLSARDREPGARHAGALRHRARHAGRVLPRAVRACAHELAAVALPRPTWRRRTTSSASRRTPTRAT